MGWELLSSNTNVPISYALFKEFVHKWNFESLAKNESLQWNEAMFTIIKIIGLINIVIIMLENFMNHFVVMHL